MDDVDVASEHQEMIEKFVMASIQQKVFAMPVGHEGDCDKCGNHSQRLMDAEYFESRFKYGIAAMIIDGICPPCRDKFKLP